VQALDILETIVRKAAKGYCIYIHQTNEYQERRILVYLNGKVVAELGMADGHVKFFETASYYNSAYKPWHDSPHLGKPTKLDLSDPETPDEIAKRIRKLLRKKSFFFSKTAITLFVCIVSILVTMAAILLIGFKDIIVTP
jgi:hypothetical protein